MYEYVSNILIFILQDLASIPELETITKEQPGLVEIKNVGSWIIHRCYNCSIYTHAVHREFGAALVLINSNIVVSFGHNSARQIHLQFILFDINLLFIYLLTTLRTKSS